MGRGIDGVGTGLVVLLEEDVLDLDPFDFGSAASMEDARSRTRAVPAAIVMVGWWPWRRVLCACGCWRCPSEPGGAGVMGWALMVPPDGVAQGSGAVG